jgi:cullin-associated NEDD8-dissociated protein 1
MDVDESPLNMLRPQAPQLIGAVLKQLANKSIPARLAGFTLLRHLTEILGGGFDDQVAALLSRIDAAFASSDSGAASGSGTTLKIEILAFLESFFALHSVAAYETYLDSTIVPRLVKAVNDKYNKVAAQAFSASSALVRAVRPIPPQDPISDTSAKALRAIYEATLTRLEAGATDQEVREAALSCLGDLLFHAGDALAPDFARSLGVLREAVRRETTRVIATKVAGHVAQSPTCRGDATFAAWVQETIGDIATLLKQVNRSLRVEAFASLPHLIQAGGNALQQGSVDAILSNVQPYLTVDDAHLIPSALAVVNALLVSQPVIAKAPAITKEILPRVHTLASASIVHGASLEALITFFGTLVQAGADANTLADDLIALGGGSKVGPKDAKPAYATIARCLGAVVVAAPQLASPVAKKLVAQVDSKTPTVFALLALGQIGRTSCVP